MSFHVILAIELSYLIGAIPFSVIIGKLFYGTDVRKSGSGNAGATNTLRVLGKRAGIIVLMLDMAKGMFSVSLSYYFGNISITESNFQLYQLTLGIAAALGHIFPIYLWFKGGKGVATFFGVVLSVFPVSAAICALIFLISFLIGRYVSLASIAAGLSLPFSIFFFSSDHHIPVLMMSACIPIIILYTHRQNIIRLLHGNENRFSFKKTTR